MSITVVTYAEGVDGYMVENTHEFATPVEALNYAERFNELHAQRVVCGIRRSAIINTQGELQMLQQELSVQLKKFQPDAIVPEFKTAGAAGFDLHACIGYGMVQVIYPGETVSIPTGIGIFIGDPTYGLFLWERGSMGKKGLGLRGGLVDSDYQGQIMVMLTNTTRSPVEIYNEDRIAQGVIQKVYRPPFVVVAEFPAPSQRGEGAFGSTGR